MDVRVGATMRSANSVDVNGEPDWDFTKVGDVRANSDRNAELLLNELRSDIRAARFNGAVLVSMWSGYCWGEWIDVDRYVLEELRAAAHHLFWYTPTFRSLLVALERTAS